MVYQIYKPYNDFNKAEDNLDVPRNFWLSAKKRLDFRLRLIEYSLPYRNYKECYIIDALMRAEGTLGIEIAAVLNILVPTENIAQRIICRDIITPYGMPVSISNIEGEWISDQPEQLSLYEDERYLIGIENEISEGEVNLYIFKK